MASLNDLVTFQWTNENKMEISDAKNIRDIHSILQEKIQENYRNSLRPLKLHEFNAWFNEKELGRDKGLCCYMRYLYKKDMFSPIEERYMEVVAYRWIPKKVVESPYGASYHYEIENKDNVIAIFNNEDAEAKPLVYPRASLTNSDIFKTIGLYCNDNADYIFGHMPNPMLRISSYMSSKCV